MASLGHVAVAVAAARAGDRGEGRKPPLAVSMVFLAGLSLLPDLDFVAFHMGIPYEAPFGHRGATHSIAFALAVSFLCGLVGRGVGFSPVRTFCMALAAIGSHGLLDSLTDGGRGVAFLWPFSGERFFAPGPLRVIPVAPIGLGMISAYGLSVIFTETMLFSPFLAYAFWPREGSGKR